MSMRLFGTEVDASDIMNWLERLITLKQLAAKTNRLSQIDMYMV